MIAAVGWQEVEVVAAAPARVLPLPVRFLLPGHGQPADPWPMWFDVEAVPLSFTESSPYRFENTAIVEAPAARVFQILATGERQTEWFQDFVACRWTTPEPHGVGAEREVELRALRVKERFVAWDPGKRLTFHIYAITLPLVKAMLEDMVIEPVADRRCRVTWTVHYRPSLLMRLVHPVGRAIFGKMFQASIQGLARYAQAHPD